VAPMLSDEPVAAGTKPGSPPGKGSSGPAGT